MNTISFAVYVPALPYLDGITFGRWKKRTASSFSKRSLPIQVTGYISWLFSSQLLRLLFIATSISIIRLDTSKLRNRVFETLSTRREPLLTRVVICSEFCVVIGYPTGHDGAMLPARDCPFCSCNKISSSPSECMKVSFAKYFLWQQKYFLWFLCRNWTRKRENFNVQPLSHITNFRSSARK